MQTLAAAAVSASVAREASAQPATISRADTLIATGQPTGGAPTFAQYNDFNPFHPGLDLRSSVAFVLEPLYFYSVLPDKMLPWLAEGFDYNADNTAITVRLRKGVNWNDGTPFSVDAVIFTLDILKQNGQGKGDQLYASAMARDIKQLVRVDDHTLRIELTHADPRWFFTYMTVRFTEGISSCRSTSTPQPPQRTWRASPPSPRACLTARSAPARSRSPASRLSASSSTGVTTGGAPRPASVRCRQ